MNRVNVTTGKIAGELIKIVMHDTSFWTLPRSKPDPQQPGDAVEVSYKPRRDSDINPVIRDDNPEVFVKDKPPAPVLVCRVKLPVNPAEREIRGHYRGHYAGPIVNGFLRTIELTCI